LRAVSARDWRSASTIAEVSGESQIRDAYVVNQDQLAVNGEFEGHEHGGTGISMIFVDAASGDGPSLPAARVRELR
jgi:hypothetical protein